MSILDRIHQQRHEKRDASALFATKSSRRLSKQQQQQQEELWEANSEYFDNDNLPTKHISSNVWPRSSYGRKLRKRTARPWMNNVEIRELHAPHLLAGQLGLFVAIEPFRQFDIIGEYCGQVFEEEDGNDNSVYATYLEDRDKKYALGVDAFREGNECRFINHYQGIANEPNVVMKTCYVDELPRVMIVCTKDIIDIGQEILLQYSDEYVKAYIDD